MLIRKAKKRISNQFGRYFTILFLPEKRMPLILKPAKSRHMRYGWSRLKQHTSLRTMVKFQAHITLRLIKEARAAMFAIADTWYLSRQGERVWQHGCANIRKRRQSSLGSKLCSSTLLLPRMRGLSGSGKSLVLKWLGDCQTRLITLREATLMH